MEDGDGAAARLAQLLARQAMERERAAIELREAQEAAAAELEEAALQRLQQEAAADNAALERPLTERQARQQADRQAERAQLAETQRQVRELNRRLQETDAENDRLKRGMIAPGTDANLPEPVNDAGEQQTPFRFRPLPDVRPAVISPHGASGSGTVDGDPVAGTSPAAAQLTAATNIPHLIAPTDLNAHHLTMGALQTTVETLQTTRELHTGQLAAIRDIATQHMLHATAAAPSSDPMQCDDEPGPSAAAPAQRTTAPAASTTVRAANDLHAYMTRAFNKVPVLGCDDKNPLVMPKVAAWLTAVESANRLAAADVGEHGKVLHLVYNALDGDLYDAASRRLEEGKADYIATVTDLTSWVRKYTGVTGDSVRDDAMRALQQQRIKMRDGETVIAYHSRFDHMLLTAGEGIVSADYALRQFFFGLSPALRIACATDALGQEWTDIALLVAYAAGKQKAMRASEAHTRTPAPNQGRGGQGWNKNRNPNSHGKPHGNNARSHGEQGNSQAQVNVQVGKRAQEEHDKRKPPAWQGGTSSHQHGAGGASTSGRGAAQGMPEWGEQYCKAYGLCKCCLRHPGFEGMAPVSPDQSHSRHKGAWVCHVKGPTISWPPPGDASASLAKLQERQAEQAAKKKRYAEQHQSRR